MRKNVTMNEKMKSYSLFTSKPSQLTFFSSKCIGNIRWFITLTKIFNTKSRSINLSLSHPMIGSANLSISLPNYLCLLAVCSSIQTNHLYMFTFRLFFSSARHLLLLLLLLVGTFSFLIVVVVVVCARNLHMCDI